MSKKKSPGNQQPFRFRRHHPVGAVQAELDQEFLDHCFIDTGDLAALTDIHNPRSLIVGRTGTGKTALLYHLKRNSDNVIEIEPENLSIDYIANSTILQFFQEAGVNLDVLFRLLWRHVIVVELLQHKFDIRDESAMQRCQRTLADLLKRDKPKQKALDYLEQWGNTFWEHTEYRVREVVSNIETELSGHASTGTSALQGGADAARRLSDGERQEVVERGKQAVQQVQIKALGDVIKVLGDHVFTDEQRRYYVLIDRLDENWASDPIRHKLIRALIEEIRIFRSITPLKLLVAMRLDLVERVFKEASDTGFQEEKYRDLMMPLAWSPDHLYELAQSRLTYLLRYKYTTSHVTFEDIFPNRVGRRKTFDHILTRTAYRPRDVINYLNYVLEAAVGKTSITQDLVRSVEEQYSEDRYRSLIDEWASIYPCFGVYLELLYKRADGFRVSTISNDELESLALSLIEKPDYADDPVGRSAEGYLNGSIKPTQLRFQIIDVLYFAGAIGTKRDASSSIRWVFEQGVIRSSPDVKSDSRVYVHPMLHRRLSIANHTSRGGPSASTRNS